MINFRIANNPNQEVHVYWNDTAIAIISAGPPLDQSPALTVLCRYPGIVGTSDELPDPPDDQRWIAITFDLPTPTYPQSS